VNLITKGINHRLSLSFRRDQHTHTHTHGHVHADPTQRRQSWWPSRRRGGRMPAAGGRSTGGRATRAGTLAGLRLQPCARGGTRVKKDCAGTCPGNRPTLPGPGLAHGHRHRQTSAHGRAAEPTTGRGERARLPGCGDGEQSGARPGKPCRGAGLAADRSSRVPSLLSNSLSNLFCERMSGVVAKLHGCYCRAGIRPGFGDHATKCC
jgi:hypothetical protein